MIISFTKDHPKLDPIFVNYHELAPVSWAKILGNYMYVDLKWNAHISYIVKSYGKNTILPKISPRSIIDLRIVIGQGLSENFVEPCKNRIVILSKISVRS